MPQQPPQHDHANDSNDQPQQWIDITTPTNTNTSTSSRARNKHDVTSIHVATSDK